MTIATIRKQILFFNTDQNYDSWYINHKGISHTFNYVTKFEIEMLLRY